MARFFENGEEVIQYTVLDSGNAVLDHDKVIAMSPNYKGLAERNAVAINCELIMSFKCDNETAFVFRRYDFDTYVLVENNTIFDASANDDKAREFANYWRNNR